MLIVVNITKFALREMSLFSGGWGGGGRRATDFLNKAPKNSDPPL